jgi:hypothetical protein
MKLTLVLAALIFSQASFAFPFVYNCVGDFDITLTVKSKSKVLLNMDDTTDELKVDLAFARANPEKKSVRLVGSSEVLGDGSEGYSVNQTMSKVMLEGTKFGYLNSYAYGPDGATSSTYKCALK